MCLVVGWSWSGFGEVVGPGPVVVLSGVQGALRCWVVCLDVTICSARNAANRPRCSSVFATISTGRTLRTVLPRYSRDRSVNESERRWPGRGPSHRPGAESGISS